MARIRSRRLLLVVLALSVSALGTYALGAAAGVQGASLLSQPAKSIPPNREAGLTDTQRRAMHDQERSAADARYAQWLNHLDMNKINLRGLPRVSLNASVIPGEPSLHDAVAKSDLVIVGTVSAFKPTPFSGTDLGLTIVQTLKGTSFSHIVVKQAGGLRPTPDWSGIVIAQLPGESLLLPGDRAVLMLQKATTGSYSIQSISGFYVVVNGQVQASPLNEAWGHSVNGSSESDFIKQVSDAK